MICSERLAQLRREHDYTQEQLAELIGVSRQTISKWETGAANPDIEKLMQLSKLYNCSVDYMVGNKINSKQNEEFKPQSKKKNNIKKTDGFQEINKFYMTISYFRLLLHNRPNTNNRCYQQATCK